MGAGFNSPQIEGKVSLSCNFQHKTHFEKNASLGKQSLVASEILLLF